MSRHEEANEAAARAFLARQAVGGVLAGTVTHVVPFGAFVEVADGVHGLVHESEWSERPEPGVRMRVEILAIDADTARMSLRPA
jgi:ribosomal protein S1